MISSSTLISTLHALHELKAVELVFPFIRDDTNVPGHNNIVSDSNGLQKLKKQIKLRNQINPLPPQ